MKIPSIQCEYIYADSNMGSHHTYLLPSVLKIISSHKRSYAKLRVLDLGCGNGSLSHLIAQQGHEVVGVEDSESGVRLARSSFSSCQFIQASIYDLPYSDLEKGFDIVISVEVIEHLLYPRQLVRAAKRCLKPNGHLILTTPYHGYFKNLAIAVSGKMDRHFTSLWDGGHVKFFSVSTMKELLKAEEFADINFKFAGGLPYLWKSMLCSSTLALS